MHIAYKIHTYVHTHTQMRVLVNLSILRFDEVVHFDQNHSDLCITRFTFLHSVY